MSGDFFLHSVTSAFSVHPFSFSQGIVTTIHDCWPHTANHQEGEKKKERNNCFRTYTCISLCFSSDCQDRKWPKGGLWNQSLSLVINYRFASSSSFSVKESRCFERLNSDLICLEDSQGERASEKENWWQSSLTSCMTAVRKTIDVNWSKNRSYSCRWYWFSANNRPFSCSSWRICSSRECVCWLSTLVLHCYWWMNRRRRRRRKNSIRSN